MTNIAARLLQPTGAGGNNTLRLANNSGNANAIQFWSTNTAAQQSSILSTNSTFSYGTYVANQLNLFGGTGGIGIRTNNSAPIRFYATNADGDFSTVQMQMFGATGNVTLQNGGTFTDAGFRLDVNGTARVQGNLRIAYTTAAAFDQMLFLQNSLTTGVTSIGLGNTGGSGIIIGKGGVSYAGYKNLTANSNFLYVGSGDLVFQTDNVSSTIIFASGNSSTAHMTIKSNGRINIASLPTSSSGLSSGDLWNDVGFVRIA